MKSKEKTPPRPSFTKLFYAHVIYHGLMHIGIFAILITVKILIGILQDVFSGILYAMIAHGLVKFAIKAFYNVIKFAKSLKNICELFKKKLKYK